MIPFLAEIAASANPPVVVFDTLTGRVFGVGTCDPESIPHLAREPHHSVLVGERPAIFDGVASDTHWVNGGAVVERPEHKITADRLQIVADGAEAVTFSGVPAGAHVSLNREHRGDADGEPVHFSTNRPGRHTIRFECFPIRDAEFTIEAANALDR